SLAVWQASGDNPRLEGATVRRATPRMHFMNAENPFEPSRLPAHSASEPVLVNPSLTRTMGTLSIVLGSLLLLCGLCSGLYMSALSMMGPAMKGAQSQ